MHPPEVSKNNARGNLKMRVFFSKVNTMVEIFGEILIVSYRLEYPSALISTSYFPEIL